MSGMKPLPNKVLRKVLLAPGIAVAPSARPNRRSHSVIVSSLAYFPHWLSIKLCLPPPPAIYAIDRPNTPLCRICALFLVLADSWIQPAVWRENGNNTSFSLPSPMLFYAIYADISCGRLLAKRCSTTGTGQSLGSYLLLALSPISGCLLYTSDAADE